MHAIEETLAAIGKQVLETMAFIFPMPGENPPAGGEEAVRATVEFEGPLRGSFSLTLPKTLLPEIVVNMLGEEEGAAPPEQKQYDALGELANVICGNLVQAIAGPQPVFRLGSPQIDAKPTPAPHRLEAGATPVCAGAATSVRLTLESGWVELALIIEDRTPGRGDPPGCGAGVSPVNVAQANSLCRTGY